MPKQREVKSMTELLVRAINLMRDKAANVSIHDVLPVGPLLAATGIGVGGGIAASAIADASSNKGAKLRRNINLYRDIESPIAGEETAIDNNIDKTSSLAVDIPVVAGSVAIPGLMALAGIKDKVQKKKTDKGRKEVGALRDEVNKAYREDMLKAYGIEDESELHDALASLRERASELNKVSVTLPLSTTAAAIAAGSLGLANFVNSKDNADKNDPRRQQNKEYLKKLDRLYRERLVSPTIRELPFSDEELLAMELFKQEGRNRKAPKSEGPKAVLDEAPAPDFEPTPETDKHEVDMDNEDIQSILKEL